MPHLWELINLENKMTFFTGSFNLTKMLHADTR